MDRNAITTLAKGLVPFVRELVEPLEKRVTEIEARPIEKGETGERGIDGSPGPEGPAGPKGESGELALLPPDLAEQVASAVRMLHEAPPIEQRSEVLPPSSPAKVTRIERDDDGSLVPIYDR